MTRPGRALLAQAVLRVEPMPPGGRTVTLSADETERARIAERLKISALDRLDVALEAVRFRGGVRVTGRVEAETVQPCVVTFEPVHQLIDEPVDRIFLPASQGPRDPAPATEVFVDLEGEDPPDYFDGIDIDLSELIVETVALALDPYPRAPGASVDALVEPEDKDESPFAALLKLKGGDDKA